MVALGGGLFLMREVPMYVRRVSYVPGSRLPSLFGVFVPSLLRFVPSTLICIVAKGSSS